MPYYQIQVNIAGGHPAQWKTISTIFSSLNEAKELLRAQRSQWDGILSFRLCKTEIMEETDMKH